MADASLSKVGVAIIRAPLAKAIAQTETRAI